MTPEFLTLMRRPDDLETAYGGVDNQRTMDPCPPTDASECVRRGRYGFNYRGERVLFGAGLIAVHSEIENRIATGELNAYTGADPNLVAYRMLAEQGGPRPVYSDLFDAFARSNTLAQLETMRRTKQTLLEYLDTENLLMGSAGGPGSAVFA